MCTKQQDFDLKTTLVPLYGTQGGGLATWDGTRYVWYADIPDFLTDAKVGDPIPKEWGVASANEAAHREVEEQENAAWDEHEFGPHQGFCDFCGNLGCQYCFGRS